ncbi:putative peptide transporter ptr2 [Smittium culicis]|uniref:Putative peptide transporter ptr2 n=1 Tax=Smittium culicis TaxID=133412 RepID=A0A1R1Y0U5_9FUNG|nr:putative peptide transporter ptr2 [Smittium culicis]
MGPIKRISIGFFALSIALIYTSVLQSFVIKNYGFGNYGFGKYDFDNNSNVSIWFHVPIIILLALSVVFSSITGMELAYSQAHSKLKTTIIVPKFGARPPVPAAPQTDDSNSVIAEAQPSTKPVEKSKIINDTEVSTNDEAATAKPGTINRLRGTVGLKKPPVSSLNTAVMPPSSNEKV